MFSEGSLVDVKLHVAAMSLDVVSLVFSFYPLFAGKNPTIPLRCCTLSLA
jgi:hypothetical protein